MPVNVLDAAFLRQLYEAEGVAGWNRLLSMDGTFVIPDVVLQEIDFDHPNMAAELDTWQMGSNRVSLDFTTLDDINAHYQAIDPQWNTRTIGGGNGARYRLTRYARYSSGDM